MRFSQISCTIRSGRPQLYQDTTQQEEYISKLSQFLDERETFQGAYNIFR